MCRLIWGEATRLPAFWQCKAIQLVERDHWYKKDVVLDIPGYRLTLGVAQELFSSHEVDAGSRHLLRSLPALAAQGTAVDFGCGYGVLGLAVAKANPGWSVDLVDRDALAVEFSQRNAVRNGLAGQARCRTGLDASGEPDTGWDLIVWNVPGKVGEGVQRAMLGDCLQRLAQDGLLALVIVNPLADLVRSEIPAVGFEITHDQEKAEHTVIHVRRILERTASDDGSLFAAGVFDREPVTFDSVAGGWTITPVIGLPEYGSLDFSTELALGVLGDESHQRALIFRPGQGHIALGVRNLAGVEAFVLHDRDALALAASRRALAGSGVDVTEVARADIPALDANVSLAVLMLEDQIRPVVMEQRIQQLCASSGLREIVVAGASTPVSRFGDMARKATTWKVRDKEKRKGHAVLRFVVR